MSDLAIFDLDHTLISVDVSNAWIVHVLQNQWATDTAAYQRQYDAFCHSYQQGNVQLRAFTEFLLQPLVCLTAIERDRRIAQFVSDVVTDTIYSRARETLQQHRDRGDQLLLISASVDLLVRPVASLLGFMDSHILSVQSAQQDGVLNGKVVGTMTFREGKIAGLASWLKQHGVRYKRSHFYSDSHHDLPLLSAVDVPVAVNPDPILHQHAVEQQWGVLQFADADSLHKP